MSEQKSVEEVIEDIHKRLLDSDGDFIEEIANHVLDESGQCVGQHFISSDDVSYENQFGENVEDEIETLPNQSFDMKQPHWDNKVVGRIR